MAKIIGVETAFPEHRYPQHDVMDMVKNSMPEHGAIIERLNSTSGVAFKNLVLPLDQYPKLGGFEARNQVYLETMVSTLARAVSKLHLKLGFNWKDIGVITSTSVTGVAVPTLDARLMNLFPIPHHVVRNPLFGIGCLGGVSGLNRTHDLLKAYPNKLGLVVAAEACSLTFQLNDVSMANMVACSLFGDGTAAVLLAGDDHPLAGKARLEIVDSMNTFYPNTERIMGWDMLDTGFKVVLSGNVPEIVEKYVAEDAEAFVNRNGLTLDKIENLISHPGGPKVLKSVQKVLQKDESLLRHSWESLRDNGNMSSVSVLDVLKRSIDQNTLKKGYGVALAMGPAFNSEMSLIKVRS
ncbi:MAG TPA: hypothetical protein VNJ08_10665 [Bacteriovoracaceae bacterium]|nr:hypothetical protein [Bacteriovoracaceae bacterium]